MIHPAELEIGDTFRLKRWPGFVRGCTYWSPVEKVVRKGIGWVQSEYEHNGCVSKRIYHRNNTQYECVRNSSSAGA